ncbi:2-oxoglutarate dehydrogenase E1 component [Roseisolibacter sp. H3M3-2]|uniref:2-oxoglutarate dehydrogenase E1 component n=1 Tax=Roseisolibacter sp. H3M3-2 TaxID=3031323 RepID=UPI0023DAA718|nr:2-oxoglutarate dehydrogenase E1 component [Roseisolibacter sp. H3M3-2]MDF1504487.1 2-oxoglutarate dehydrogenase E1 component [Roseisolibacter sp. H3M3-2]
MTSPAITSVFNDAYIAEAFESYRRDPASVDESWRQYFRTMEALAGLTGGAPAGGGGGDPELPRKAAAAASLVHGIREHGHLAVRLDPLGSEPLGARELTPEHYGIAEADLEAVPASALGFGDGRFRTAADVVRMLRTRYSGTFGLEYSHLASDAEREWFRQMLKAEHETRALTADERKAVLRRLTQVDGLERFLGFAYQGKKRFSIEGTDALVPMLDEAIAQSAARGAREVVIGMAHRGRLNVLTHVMGKPYEVLFGEFEGRHPDASSESETGDVKYHMGYRGRREVGGREVALLLVPNPSHLEFVGAVIDGVARAHQRVEGKPGTRDERLVLPIAVHGDAAFMGEGVVAESLNMARLAGYRVGGTLHLIVNNQVGFTTDPIDSRSTHYASDLAKGFDVPVLHVNADDAQACLAAVRVAIAYREAFAKDVLIDLVGYRRHGHNETDEPAFTQPKLYDAIKAHPTPRQVWGRRLVDEGLLSADEVEAVDREVRAEFQSAHERVKRQDAHEPESPEGPPAALPAPVVTAVPADRLTALNDALLRYPEGFTPHPRLGKILARRAETLGEKGGIEWGQAEALAFASLVAEGVNVRLTGQDAERGTFGHRNAVLHDPTDGKTHTPLASLPDATAAFEVYNSPLTETAVMAFDYGYSVAAPDTLALWEAQYGDFVNVAQVVIDQFLVADRAKWSQDSGLVLLLPHGYEGGGPEHSSARLERFLQQCAEGNMTVAYPGTPAQYFHLLRLQARRQPRRPLVLMQPKSLLRLPAATSRLGDLAEGAWQPVVDLAAGAADRVRRVVLCTAKMWYDVTAQPVPDAVAVVRVDQLYPFPGDAVREVLARYPKATEVVWAQEEPQNMGAWTFAAPRLRALLPASVSLGYVGRPERASPAEGYEAAHKAEQGRIVAEALAITEPAKQKATA